MPQALCRAASRLAAQQRHELALAHHLVQDVGATHELPVDVQLHKFQLDISWISHKLT